jgi:hypothetical protein
MLLASILASEGLKPVEPARKMATLCTKHFQANAIHDDRPVKRLSVSPHD